MTFEVASRFVFESKPMGTGGFSKVFGGRDKKTGMPVALKVDTSHITAGVRRRPMVTFEAAVLRDMHAEKPVQGNEGNEVKNSRSKTVAIPRLHWSGQTALHDKQEYPAIIMDRLHCSISEWNNKLRKTKNTLSIRQAAIFTIDLIQVLEHVHACGYVHRDIKPDNMMLGISPDDRTYLVDFGLSKKFMRGGHHIPYTDQKDSMVGTPRYCSTYTHERIESSRRDDLQSIVFVFISLFFDRLPWQSTKKHRFQEEEVLRLKREFLMGCSPTNTKYDNWLRQFPPHFFRITRYIYNLGFEETPNYAYVKQGFLTAFGRRSVADTPDSSQDSKESSPSDQSQDRMSPFIRRQSQCSPRRRCSRQNGEESMTEDRISIARESSL